MSVGHKRATLQDVATAAHVSTGTASHALNDSAVVSKETRTRVLEAAQRLNYIPNRNAARLLHGRNDCIGVACPDIGPSIAKSVFYAMVLRGIAETLEEHGYSMRLLHLDMGTPDPGLATGHQQPNAKDIDGLIAFGWLDPALMGRLRRLELPLVVVDSSGAYPDLSSADNDDRGGVALGVDYLIGLGHSNIAFLGDSLDSPFGREALAGYLRTFAQHGLHFEPWLIRTGQITVDEGRRLAIDLLTTDRLPTAILAATDDLAVGALLALQDAGL